MLKIMIFTPSINKSKITCHIFINGIISLITMIPMMIFTTIMIIVIRIMITVITTTFRIVIII